MNFHIITSSYPASPQDPSGTAGLFVRQFALELVAAGNSRYIQPAARKPSYTPDLASPSCRLHGRAAIGNWPQWILQPDKLVVLFSFFLQREKASPVRINKEYAVDRTLCMWAVPSGIFGLAGKLETVSPMMSGR